MIITNQQLFQCCRLGVAVIVENPNEIGTKLIAFAHSCREAARTSRIFRQSNDGNLHLVLQWEVLLILVQVRSGIVGGGIVDDDELFGQSSLRFQRSEHFLQLF